jgi:hypothetical protein
VAILVNNRYILTSRFSSINNSMKYTPFVVLPL